MVNTTDVLTAIMVMLEGIEDKMVKNDVVGAHKDIITAMTQIADISKAIDKAKRAAPLKEMLERKD